MEPWAEPPLLLWLPEPQQFADGYQYWQLPLSRQHVPKHEVTKALQATCSESLTSAFWSD